MMTGMHRVSDIHCKACMKLVGWTYVGPFFIIIYRFMLMSRARSTKRGNSSLSGHVLSNSSTQTRISLAKSAKPPTLPDPR